VNNRNFPAYWIARSSRAMTVVVGREKKLLPLPATTGPAFFGAIQNEVRAFEQES